MDAVASKAAGWEPPVLAKAAVRRAVNTQRGADCSAAVTHALVVSLASASRVLVALSSVALDTKPKIS